jgi:multicomponent Na+:H+ antiporter subunit G
MGISGLRDGERNRGISELDLVVQLLSCACLFAGAFFTLVGGIGILRMPDFFTRLHAGGVTDTVGAGLVLIGLMIYAGPNLVSVKLLLILLFMLFTNPTATHALAKAALHGGTLPLLTDRDGGDATSNS